MCRKNVKNIKLVLSSCKCTKSRFRPLPDTLDSLGDVYIHVKPCPHCRRKRRLSQKSATVAENGEKTSTVAEFGDSRTFLRQSLVATLSTSDSVDRLLRQ